MEKKVFSISGMHCNSCAQIIELDLEELQGVKAVKVDFAAGKATVEFDKSLLSEQKIIEAIKKAGYSARAG